jgi:hypothetical protein
MLFGVGKAGNPPQADFGKIPAHNLYPARVNCENAPASAFPVACWSGEEVKTHSFPLGINFFHPSGLGASLKATYYDQEGVFKRVNTGEFSRGEDDFWVVDAAINYRLPKRYGFITVGATNLFDKDFNYFDTDINNPRIRPDSFFFIRATLAIP